MDGTTTYHYAAMAGEWSHNLLEMTKRGARDLIPPSSSTMLGLLTYLCHSMTVTSISSTSLSPSGCILVRVPAMGSNIWIEGVVWLGSQRDVSDQLLVYS